MSLRRTEWGQVELVFTQCKSRAAKARRFGESSNDCIDLRYVQPQTVSVWINGHWCRGCCRLHVHQWKTATTKWPDQAGQKY